MKKFIIPLIVMVIAFIAMPKSPVREHVEQVMDHLNPPPETMFANVNRIVDGDTIELANGDTVRLIGIDAPESRANDKAKRDAQRTGQDVRRIKQMGKEVTRFVKGVVRKGDRVMLEFDAQKTDRYGRLLAYVYREVEGYQPGRDDQTLEGFIVETNCPHGMRDEAPRFERRRSCRQWLMLNAELVYDGYVQPMTISPNVRYSDEFKDLYQEARRKERGFWDNRQWRYNPKKQNPISYR